MSNLQDVRHLVDLARDSSRQARARLVDSIGDLLAEREPSLTDRERALMTEILERLLKDFETPIRRKLSERLASSPNAPAALISMLASDEAEVARPVLMKSPVLRDQELIEIVCNRTREHQLAIAVRSEVSEPVSEALIHNGDNDVIRTLLENPNSRISQATAEYLVEQARRSDALQQPLVARTELSPQLATRLYWYVSAALRARILERFPVSEAEIDDALEAAAAEVADRERERFAAGRGAPAGESTPARRLARHIAEERRVDAALVLKVLRRGEIPLFEALFAEMSGVHPPRLQHVLYENKGKGLAIVCRALKIEKANFVPIFLLSRKGRGGDQQVDPRELWQVLQVFESVNLEGAQRVLRRWQRSPAYLDAIESLEDAELELPAVGARP